MRVSSIEEYSRIEPIEDLAEWDSLHLQFPYAVVVECDFPEWSFAIRWCWQQFGQHHGVCYGQLEYAVCPLNLATERIEKAWGNNKEYLVKRYSQVAAHHHFGSWTTYWFGKTDYDHGFGEFFFSNEADKKKFLEFVPQVEWGENFPWLKEQADG